MNRIFIHFSATSWGKRHLRRLTGRLSSLVHIRLWELPELYAGKHFWYHNP
jgi:hypothetical protein